MPFAVTSSDSLPFNQGETLHFIGKNTFKVYYTYLHTYNNDTSISSTLF